jgi:hypothetical protein
MITRNKLYYPKSHIVTNLHTNGKEWMFEDTIEYIGYYHRYIDGTILSGAVFNRTESKNLIPYVSIVNDPINVVYNSLKPKLTFKAPTTVYTIPELEDYETGKIVRYFLRRRNLASYEDIIEIGKDQYKLWKKTSGGIDKNLYDAITLDWKLTGPLYDIRDSVNIVYGVFDTNKRMVELKTKDFIGLKDFLTDYIEYSIYSPFVSQEIKKLFVYLN